MKLDMLKQDTKQSNKDKKNRLLYDNETESIAIQIYGLFFVADVMSAFISVTSSPLVFSLLLNIS